MAVELALESVGYRYPGGHQAVSGVGLALGPGIAVSGAMTFADLRRLPLFPNRAMAIVSGAFGMVALLLTVIPIAYGPYRVGSAKSFSIEPPVELNPAAGLPVWK